MAEDFRHGIDWQEACDGVPTQEYAVMGRDLSDPNTLEGVVESFVNLIEGRTYLVWEAVIRDEQELPLSRGHATIVRRLIAFNEDDGEGTLYIDGRPRPCEPWYETLRRIAAHLLVETYSTAASPQQIIRKGWSRLVEALDEQGRYLSLPEGVTNHVDVVPEELRHRLWVQSCFNKLSGIGEDGFYGVISLEDAEERYRVDEFINSLREHKESVAALELTLEKLLEVVLMPSKEQELFIELFTKTLGLSSNTDPIAEHL